jgi:hypothetical protein
MIITVIPRKKIWLDVIKTDVHVTIVIDDVIYVISDWSAKKSGPFRFGVDEKTTWDRHSRCERLLLVFIAVAAVSAGHHLPTWRIHGAGIFMVLHGSHEYTPLMLAYIYTIHGSGMGMGKFATGLRFEAMKRGCKSSFGHVTNFNQKHSFAHMQHICYMFQNLSSLNPLQLNIVETFWNSLSHSEVWGCHPSGAYMYILEFIVLSTWRYHIQNNNKTHPRLPSSNRSLP